MRIVVAAPQGWSARLPLQQGTLAAGGRAHRARGARAAVTQPTTYVATGRETGREAWVGRRGGAPLDSCCRGEGQEKGGARSAIARLRSHTTWH